MKIICVEGRGSNEQAPRLLQYSPSRFRIQRSILLRFVDVETQASIKAYGDYNGVVGGSVLDRGEWFITRISSILPTYLPCEALFLRREDILEIY